MTPGEDPNYYAAVARAEERDKSPVKDVKSGRQRSPTKLKPSQVRRVTGRLPGRSILTGKHPRKWAALSIVSTCDALLAPCPQRASLLLACSQFAPQPSYGEEDEEESGGGGDEGMTEHDKMLDTILEEEELLITAHRMHIEETMELVRAETTRLLYRYRVPLWELIWYPCCTRFVM